jgi:hypothetical protein
MEGQELTTITGGQVGIFNPEEQLDMAIRAAKALAKVIAGKKKPVIINGETYLEFEDWQTLGQFDGVSVRTGDVEMVEINGVQGAKAKAYLVNNKIGEIIGGAEAYCMRDEEKWGTRPKYEWQGEGDKRKRVKVGDEVVPWFQLASMAQTRAGSKALRNKESWIAVLAGYRPTPAEEMTESTVSEATQERRTVDRTQHYCPIHDVNFFKKGRMKNYAHPIEGTDPVEWCNEGDVDTGKTQSQVEAEPSPEDVGGVTEPVAEESNTKASNEQIAKLNTLRARGINLKGIIEEYGWQGITKPSDFTHDQAARIIEENKKVLEDAK